MKISLREYFHALNVLNETVILSFVGDDACYVVRPPIRLTSEGEKRFGNILDHPDIYIDVKKYRHNIMSDKDEIFNDFYDNGEGLLEEVRCFVNFQAGYCDPELFQKWFESEDAKLI